MKLKNTKQLILIFLLLFTLTSVVVANTESVSGADPCDPPEDDEDLGGWQKPPGAQGGGFGGGGNACVL
ncbi:MAG: hypothetical protein ACW981_02560 [Candidatus Hodarchaeales archaeon]|jgi:hypothetical protein